MKSITKFLLSSVLLNAGILLAQNNQTTDYRLKDRLEARGYRLEEIESKTTGNNKTATVLEYPSFQISQLVEPTTNCDNLGQDLSCHLMMDPLTLGKGAETLGEVVELFTPAQARKAAQEREAAAKASSTERLGKVTSSKPPIVATAVAYSPVGSNVFSSSSAAEVPTAYSLQPTTSIRPTGRIAAAATTVIAAEETGEENSTAQFLEQEICDNIYLSCFAKVAAMSASERARVEGAVGVSQEAKEWAAAEQKALRDVEKRKKELTKATKERTVAYKEMESADASFHGRDYVSKANADFKVKECAEQLAEAKVATAEATLFAIRVKDTAQGTGAKADLMEAIEEEKKAQEVLKALEEARAHGLEQNIASPSIPMAVAVEAVPFYPDHHSYEAYPHYQQFSPLNVSSERGAQERQEETLAKKEKAAVAFETEFSETLREAKAQVEEVGEAAEAARGKADRQETSEKAWNEAIEEAEIAEGAYAHLGELYKMYQEEVSKHYEGGILRTKCSKYKIELTKAEKKKAHWTNEIAECRQKKEALKRGEPEKALEQTRIAEAKTAQERESVRIAEQEIPEVQQIISTSETSEKTAAQKETALDESVVQKATIVVPVQTPSQQTIPLNRTTDAQADHFIQSAPPQEVGSERLPIQQAQQTEIEKQQIEKEDSENNQLLLKAKTQLENAKSLAKFAERSYEQAKNLPIKNNDNKAWTETIQKFQKALEAYNVATEAYKTGLNQALPRFKALWGNELTIAEQEKKTLLKQVVVTYGPAIDNNGDGAIMRYTLNSIQMSANCIISAIKAVKEGAGTKAQEYFKVAETYQKSVEEFIQCIYCAIEKKSEPLFFSSFINSRSMYSRALIMECKIKASEARLEGKTLLAQSYAIEEEKLEKAVSLLIQAAQAIEAGKTKDMNNLLEAGWYMTDSAWAMIKGIEASEAENTSLAESYRKTSALYFQTMQAVAAGKRTEGSNLRNAGCSMEKSVEAMMKRIEVSEAGNTSLAEFYKKAEELYLQAAQACAAGKEGTLWLASIRMDRSTRAMIEKTEAIKAGKTSLAESYKKVEEFYLQAAQAYAAGNNEGYDLNNAAEYMEKSVEAMMKGIEASEAGKTSLAESYKKAEEFYLQAAQAYAAGKSNEGRNLHYAAQYIEESAEAMMKGIEASEAGKTSLAESYRKKAEKLENAAELRTQAAQAYTAGKSNEGSNLSDAGKHMKDSIEAMMKKIEASEAGKTSLAESYKKTEELSLQASQAYAAGKCDEGSNLSSAGRCMERSAEAMMKKIEASEAGKTSLAESYKKAEEFYLQAAQAYAAGKENEGHDLWNASIYMDSSTRAMIKGIEASEAGKTSLAESYKKAEEFYLQSAQAYAAGKSNEGSNLSDAGKHMTDSVEAMMKRIEASEAGKTSLAESYKKVEELYLQSAQAYAAGKKDEGRNLWYASRYMESSTEAMIKGIEASEAGKTSLAESYRKQAEKFEKAVELQTQAAQAYTAGKGNEGSNLSDAGKYMAESAEAMMKAIGAKETGNTTLATEHTAAAEASQKKAEEYVRAAQLAAEVSQKKVEEAAQLATRRVMQPPAPLSQRTQPVSQPPAPLARPTQPVLQPPAPQKTSWFGKLFKK